MTNPVTAGSIKGHRHAQWEADEEKNGKQEIQKNREKEKKRKQMKKERKNTENQK